MFHSTHQYGDNPFIFLSSHKQLCTYQCKPRGGGSAGKGWGFDGEIHLLGGRFDRVPLPGGRDI